MNWKLLFSPLTRDMVGNVVVLVDAGVAVLWMARRMISASGSEICFAARHARDAAQRHIRKDVAHYEDRGPPTSTVNYEHLGSQTHHHFTHCHAVEVDTTSFELFTFYAG